MAEHVLLQRLKVDEFSSILCAHVASGIHEGEENKGFEWMFYFL
jgi:hypothetical protein